MSDTAIALESRVDHAINGNPHLAGRHLNVAAYRGTIVLTGEVGSYYQKQIAQETVWNVEGVSAVENQLVVPRKAK